MREEGITSSSLSSLSSFCSQALGLVLFPIVCFLLPVSCSLNLNNAPSLCSWPSAVHLHSPHRSIPNGVGLREGGLGVGFAEVTPIPDYYGAYMPSVSMLPGGLLCPHTWKRPALASPGLMPECIFQFFRVMPSHAYPKV